jgi:hypothetical protein
MNLSVHFVLGTVSITLKFLRLFINNGDEMTKTVKDYMNKHKISVEVVIRRI